MLLSRGATLLRNAYRVSERKPVATSLNQISRSYQEWCYRTLPKNPPKGWLIVAELCGGIMWWWILWCFWHEHEHLTGHFPYPRPIDWTDEELGIPPLDRE